MHQTTMKEDEQGEIETEGLREERIQGKDLDDDSAIKQRENLTAQARELTREREVVRGRDTEREGEGSREREINQRVYPARSMYCVFLQLPCAAY